MKFNELKQHNESKMMKSAVYKAQGWTDLHRQGRQGCNQTSSNDKHK